MRTRRSSTRVHEEGLASVSGRQSTIRETIPGSDGGTDREDGPCPTPSCLWSPHVSYTSLCPSTPTPPPSSCRPVVLSFGRSGSGPRSRVLKCPSDWRAEGRGIPADKDGCLTVGVPAHGTVGVVDRPAVVPLSPKEEDVAPVEEPRPVNVGLYGGSPHSSL